ncbi:MAG: PEP-CTERM sorting domain-containing protein [Verrucomicrobiota bacterium]
MMKKRIQPSFATASVLSAGLTLALALSFAPGLQASTIITAPAGGITYNQGLSLGQNDSGSVAGSVGQWSWQDPAIADAQVPNGGWGHTSNWIALTLTEPAVLSLALTRNAAVPMLPSGFFPTENYFPAFTIWKNWDTDASPMDFYDSEMQGKAGNYHVYPNTGNVAWAEDLAYLDHYRNGGVETSVTDSWLLPAGNYTFAVGGLAPSSVGASRQGYLATFTTSAVPEPGGVALTALAGLAVLNRRRRHSSR